MEKVSVTLIKSPNGCLAKQKATLEALGLHKIGNKNEFVNSDTLKGQLFVVKHLVKVEKI